MKYEERQYPTRQDMRDEIGRLREELTTAQTWQEHLLKSNGELEAERNSLRGILKALYHATPDGIGMCEIFHHAKKDQHGDEEDCPCERPEANQLRLVEPIVRLRKEDTVLKTTGIDIDAIRVGNPTCKYCGVTYSLTERHDCMFSQEAKLKTLQEKHDALFDALKLARTTLRDQFAMAVMQGILSSAIHATDRSEANIKELPTVSYQLADAMMEARKQ